ncbi:MULTISPECIES: Vms1/Ankzf1 family peptidyl-tRNA hydrolase [Actinoalloteichus]|uniref:ERF1 domain 3 n=1 Tax=Actinoalloteichus fjordicus TaxID=1612552 RepID=A0AAC9PUC7_9PSEU|nr:MULTISPECIES: Vms1/Ankzf1 family peptidyl-tRNA hydrolase [Actinoalloteichus]APU16957.1 eRF1 domain 3 [Actinoalloteichus fjordicus]APU23037.1 eRF1 domain 3 [Actinoalloteichus sp. GBA129-24]
MELGLLRELATRSGPCAVAYLDVTRDTEEAYRAIALRRRAIEEELADRGVDAATLSAVDEALESEPWAVGRAGRAVVAQNGTVLLDRLIAEPPENTITAYSRVPDVFPLVAAVAAEEPVVVAVVDRIGADIGVHVRDGGWRTDRTVEGEDRPVHKVRGLGWSQNRVQRRVENTAAHNAAEIAREVDRAAAEIGTRLIVIAGEVQARTEVLAALPARSKSIAVEAEHGGRAAGSDRTALAEEIQRLAAEFLADEAGQVVERFQAELAAGQGLAVSGPERVVAALQAGAVDTILLPSDGMDREVTVGDDVTDIRFRDAHRTDGGDDDLGVGRVDSAVALAAAATDAHLFVIDPVSAVPDGVGAVLRFPMPR